MVEADETKDGDLTPGVKRGRFGKKQKIIAVAAGGLLLIGGGSSIHAHRRQAFPGNGLGEG
jgi:hypothetical protein